MNALLETPALQLLRKFCADSSDSRTYMHTPHVIRGRVVATNGRLFAVLPADTDPGALPCADDRYNPSDLIGIADAWDGDLIKACDVGVRLRQCLNCAGTGKCAKPDCDECDGAGEFQHGSYWYDCRKCHGSGTIVVKGEGRDCEDCEGKGFSAGISPSTLGDEALSISVACNYVLTLRDIQGEISTTPVKTKGYGYLFAFTFPGGRGLLMPMRGGPISIDVSDLAATETATEGLLSHG